MERKVKGDVFSVAHRMLVRDIHKNGGRRDLAY